MNFSTTELCAGGDSLSLEDGWVSQLPIEWTSVAQGGTATPQWVSGNSNGLLTRMVDCANETGAPYASMTLGTNDRFIQHVPAEAYEQNAGSIMDELGEYFEQVVWLWSWFDVDDLCEDRDFVTCVPVTELLSLEHYPPHNIPGLECCHPNEVGEQILADAYLAAIPEPSAGVLLAVGLVMAAWLRKFQRP